MNHIVHELKTDPSSFFRIYSGDKTFDVRLDDRHYQAGDVILFLEHDRRKCVFRFCQGGLKCPAYLGNKIYKRIGFVAKGQFYGLDLGTYAILSLIDVEEKDGYPV